MRGGTKPGIYGIREMVIGSRQETTIYAEGDRHVPQDWTEDGKWMLFRTAFPNGNSVFLIPVPMERAGNDKGGGAARGAGKAGELKLEPALTAKYKLAQFKVSPDGKWVAFISWESGRSEINLATFPAFTDRRQISTGGGVIPLWRGDSKELYFLAGDRQMMAVEIKPVGTTFEPGPVRILFQTSAILHDEIRKYAVTRDGQRFLVAEPPGRIVILSAVCDV